MQILPAQQRAAHFTTPTTSPNSSSTPSLSLIRPSMLSSTRRITPFEKQLCSSALRSHPPRPSRTAPSIHLNWAKASITRSSRLWTEGVDVAGSPEAIFCFEEMVRQRALCGIDWSERALLIRVSYVRNRPTLASCRDGGRSGDE
jgi:hypothetical protein